MHCREIDWQRALEIALVKFGVQFERETEIPILYNGIEVTRRRVGFHRWDERNEFFLESHFVNFFA